MRALTYYVLEPRDEPCYLVNPLLWREFQRCSTLSGDHKELYTESFCVQWLDLYYDSMLSVLPNDRIDIEGETIDKD